MFKFIAYLGVHGIYLRVKTQVRRYSAQLVAAQSGEACLWCQELG